MTSSVAWFPAPLENSPVGSVERLTRTGRVPDRHGSCCLWTQTGDLSITCVHCRVPGALLVGRTGQYVLTEHRVHKGPDGAVDHQALWQPHTCTGEKP
jgi:hypothetical protein